MTTSEFLTLALSGPHSENLPPELRRFIRNLYDNVIQIKLADGAGIHDTADLREFCREMMLHLEAMKKSGSVNHWICFWCHHEHEMKSHCGAYLGEEKFCQCEEKVRV